MRIAASLKDEIHYQSNNIYWRSHFMKMNKSILRAIGLVSDRAFRRSFVIELHKYLKENMPQYQFGECPWACGYDHFNSPSSKLYKHFINFCKLEGIDWFLAHTIFRAKYGEFYCDCDYLYNLKVTDDEVVVSYEESSSIVEFVENQSQSY